MAYMYNGAQLQENASPTGTDKQAEQLGEEHAVPQMRVKKRNGTLEPVDVNKIVKAVYRCCDGLAHVDANRVAIRTISGLYDGATTDDWTSCPSRPPLP